MELLYFGQNDEKRACPGIQLFLFFQIFEYLLKPFIPNLTGVQFVGGMGWDRKIIFERFDYLCGKQNGGEAALTNMIEALTKPVQSPCGVQKKIYRRARSASLIRVPDIRLT